MVESSIEEHALHQHIRRRTVRLIDLTDQSAGGSAVTVKLGNRYFLATAAHVIPPNHEIEVLVGAGEVKNVGRFSARHINEEDDVGLLELDESAAEEINRDFTEAKQLLPRIDQSNRWCATLVGYPSQTIDTVERPAGNTLFRTHSFSPLTLITSIVPPNEWPQRLSFLRREPRYDCDFFVTFDPQTTVYRQDLTNIDCADSPAPVDSVQLEGMSGCGIWLDRTLDDQVWRPEPILAGIDTGVLAKSGCARGTQIGRWLALVVENYSEFDTIRRRLKQNK